MRFTAIITTTLLLAATQACHSQSAPSQGSPVSVSIYDRTRVDNWQWFAAPPESETYSYTESLLRISIAQHIKHWDWQLELTQPAVLGVPSDAISPVTAQGQLGLGGSYYAANINTDPVAAFLKQAFLRYHFPGEDKTLRLGRIEFVEGQEIALKNPSMAWLQTNRMAQRLIGNFGFTNAQRSFDGLDAHYGSGTWDVTAMAGRADQGVFNMNGNPELNVDAQYLALTKSLWNQHFLWRAFGIGYHDGRTGVTKTDNRPLAVRQADHKNIRIGSYGGDFLTSFRAGPGNLDLLGWGVLQNGNWGLLNHRAGAIAVEGGYQLDKIASAPWLRAGFFHSSGDNNPSDDKHNSFFQVLPTPRVYARDPFFNLMNNQDGFVQLIDKPTKKLELRSDLHWLQLTSGKDLWYQGGGAFDNNAFGFVGRPGNGHTSFATLADISADWQVTHALAVNLYYSHVWGKSVVAAIYPTDRTEQFGYVEFVYHWGIPQRADKK